MNNDCKTLIIATSYSELSPVGNPRTDYVELSKIINSDILDYTYYSSYDNTIFRSIENLARLDIKLAFAGLKKASSYDKVLLMSERAAIPYLMFQGLYKNLPPAVFISMHSSKKQAEVFKRFSLGAKLQTVISFSPAQRDFLVNDMNISEEKICYIPYVIDEKFFKPQQNKTEDFILSVGGIPGRDYPTLIRAVDNTNIKTVIISGGRLYGRKTSDGLTSLPANIEVLSGFDAAQMREFYSKAKAVVIPLETKRDDAAGSSVLLEAMAMAKTTIISRSDGILPYLNDESAYITVTPENPGELKKAIENAYQNPDEKIGLNARKIIEEKLSLEIYADSLARAIKGDLPKWPLN